MTLPAEKSAPEKDPTLDVESAYFNSGAEWVIGIDEVGRGAIAGPVAVGVQAIRAGTTAYPEGLRDSKLLSEKRRTAVHPAVLTWGTGAVGFGEAREIDEHGIVRMLGVAARRALLELHSAGVPVDEASIILDGQHDWLSPVLRKPLRVVTRVGADRTCASVAAASVRAKVARDDLMRAAHLEFPHYAWESNKGYGAKAHYAGITTHGTTDFHRVSWITPRATLPPVTRDKLVE